MTTEEDYRLKKQGISDADSYWSAERGLPHNKVAPLTHVRNLQYLLIIFLRRVLWVFGKKYEKSRGEKKRL